MLYLLEVYALVAFIVFGCSGMVMLAMYVWHETREYARARMAMVRLMVPASREAIAISRRQSRFHDTNSLRLT